jgi:hypothetical protein
VGPEPGPERPLRAEQQHVDEARHHRRDREGQVDQGDEEALAPELELRDRPGGRDAEHQVERHRDRRDREGEPDRRPGVRVLEGFEIGRKALPERLDEDGRERQDQEQSEEQERDGEEDDLRALALRRDAAVPSHARISAGCRPGAR